MFPWRTGMWQGDPAAPGHPFPGLPSSQSVWGSAGGSWSSGHHGRGAPQLLLRQGPASAACGCSPDPGSPLFCGAYIGGKFMTLAKSRPRGETVFPTPAPRCCLCSCCCPSAPTPCTGSSLWRAWGSVLGTLPGVQAWLPPCGHGLSAACVLRVPGSGALVPPPGGIRGQSLGPALSPPCRSCTLHLCSPPRPCPSRWCSPGPTARVSRDYGPPTPGLAPVPHSLNLRTPLPSPELGREGSHTVVADLLPRRLALAVPACTASRVRLAAPAAPAATLLADLSLSLFLPAPPLCAP